MENPITAAVFDPGGTRTAVEHGRMQPVRRTAAVVIAIQAKPPHGVVFIERAAHLRDHPGQIALPGGSVDAQDGGDLRRTALRELGEEVGIAADRVTILAELPMVRQTRANNFDVTPFVASIAPGPLTIDGTETAAVFTIPLDVIFEHLQPGTHVVGEQSIETYLLDYESRRVWGLTGSILRSFVEAWNDDANPLRSTVEAAFAGTARANTEGRSGRV